MGVGKSLGGLVKCPGCECMFISQVDLRSHLVAFGGSVNHVLFFRKLHKVVDEGEGEEDVAVWRKGKFGDEYCLAEEDPYHVRLVKLNGGQWTADNQKCFEFKLSENGVWLKRRRLT